MGTKIRRKHLPQAYVAQVAYDSTAAVWIERQLLAVALLL